MTVWISEEALAAWGYQVRGLYNHALDPYVTTRYLYDPWGNPTIITDTRGFTTTTTYDSQYHMYPVQVSNAQGQTTQTTYDYVRGLPVMVTDPNGALTRFEYDTFGRLYEVYRPSDPFYGSGQAQNDPSTRYIYRDNGAPLWVAPVTIVEWHKPTSLQQVVRHIYDGLGREIQTHTALNVTPDGYATPQDLVVSRAYDARGLVISETVPYAVPAYSAWPANPHTTVNQAAAPKTLMQYDALGRVIRTTHPDGTFGTQSYYLAQSVGDGDFRAGRVSSNITDANNQVKRYSYDGRGALRVVTEFVPGGEYRTRYTYDALGNLTHVSDALGNTTVMTYNVLGQKTAMLDPDMGAWSYQYDPAGNLQKQTDARNQAVWFNYDALNRLIEIRQDSASGAVLATHGYDTDLNLEAHRTAVRAMEATNNLSIEDGGSLVSLSSDHMEGSAAVRVDTGNVTGSYANYRPWPQVDFGANYRWWHVRVKPLTLGAWIDFWFWDATDGRWEAVRSLDGDAHFEVGEDVHVNQWNELWLDMGAATTAGDAVESPTNAYLHTSENSSFIWDDFYAALPEARFSIGQRVSLSDTSGSAAWTYDQRGRMTQETKVISGTGGGTFVTQWDYDTLDRPLWMKYPGGNGGQVGEQVTFVYTTAGQLQSVLGASPYVQSTTYDVAGRVAARVLGNNVVQQGYVYYPWTTLRGHGRLQQLTAGVPGSPTSLQDLNYTYDAVGNVLTILDNKAGPQTQTFTYDALDRLQTAQATGGTEGTYALETYTYDALGNLKSKPGVGVYTYTAAATGCVAGTPTIKPHAVRYAGSYTFTYDCNGNMLTRADSTGTFTQQWDKENRLITVTGTATGSFVYDGDGNRVKATLNGVTTAYIGNYYEQSGNITTTYYYAGSTRVAMRQGNTVTYLLGDHLGSTSIAANGTTGALVSEQRYKPWGERRYPPEASTLPTRRQFTGQLNDSEIGLYFYNARSYSSVLGRFLSADTIVPDGKNPQQFNRYAYALNSPLNYIDPSGHMVACASDTGNGCAGIGSLYGIYAYYHNTDDRLGTDQLVATYFRIHADAEMSENPGLLEGDYNDARNMHTLVEMERGNPTAIIAFGFMLWLGSLIGPGSGPNIQRDTSFDRPGKLQQDVAADQDLQLRTSGYPCSFSADTLVATDDGEQAIATLKIGNRVLAYNPTLGKNGYYTVTAVLAHNDPVIEYLTIDGEKITTTPGHPFYTLGVGWLPAGQLWIGVHLRKANGEYGTVQGIQFVRHTQSMYNLTVAQAHTFFVGDQQWMVHNSCGSFTEHGIRTSDKFWDRLNTHGVTEKEALNVYLNGTKYTDAAGKLIRYSARTGVAVLVDPYDLGAVSVWTAPQPSRNWVKGWIQP